MVGNTNGQKVPKNNFINMGETATSSGTNTNVGSFTLNKGVYLIQLYVNFGTNGTGYRTVFLATDSSGTSLGGIYEARATAVSGAATEMNFTVVLTVGSTSTYYLFTNQNSGSSVSVYPRCNILPL